MVIGRQALPSEGSNLFKTVESVNRFMGR